MGSGSTDANLAGTLNLPAIYRSQEGLVADMDRAAEQLTSAFAAR
jgi:hypothetical protein